MSFHQFVVGDEEYQCIQLDAFTANGYLLKMKGTLAKMLSSGLNTDSANLMTLIDEDTITKVIFPLFEQCALTCVSKKVKLTDRKGMNAIFTAETLDEFYLVAWEVIKFNFGPFISKTAKNLFGVELTEVETKIKAKLQEIGKSSLEKTSTPNSGSGDQ